MSARRIGLLGGTFDPIHMGHLDLASGAQAALALTEVQVIPANVPPHRAKPLTSSFHRFAMVAIAVAGRDGWRASDVELRHEAPSYTSTTLQRFESRGYLASELYFLIGADAFADISTWREYPRILDRANFVVVSRPGCSVSELPARLPALSRRMTFDPSGARDHASTSIFLIDHTTADVSSTAIRERLSRGQSIAGLVDPRVQQHIEQHGLYRSSGIERRGALGADQPAAGRLHDEN
ncbi:MAG: nicotinate-nucleotide adenylyltransferase [Vicinamibacterales bacterium]